MGCPTKYSKEIAIEMCAAIASGKYVNWPAAGLVDTVLS